MQFNLKDLTQSLIALLIVGGVVVSLFVNTTNNEALARILQVLAGTVVGFYFGSGAAPMFGGRR